MLRALMSLVILSLFTLESFAQTKPVKKNTTPEVAAPAAPAPVAPAPAAPRTSIGGKISQKLRINYYGSYTGSALYKTDHLQRDFYGDKTTDPHNLWNQLSFNYDYDSGPKLNYVMNVRFTTQLASTQKLHEADPKADNGFMFLEDFLTGFQGVVYSQGKFTYWARYATRIPTSYASQLSKIQFQPEMYNDFNYAFNGQFQIGAWQQIRLWRFETETAAKDKRLWRAYHAAYAYYSFSDFFRLDAYYNLTMDHVGGKKTGHLKRADYTNFQIGPSLIFTPDFNIWPYIQIPDRDINLEKNAQIGMWISWNDL